MQPMRPRFHLSVPYSPERVVARFRERLACDGCPCQMTVLGDHLDVRIHDRLSHFWSPRLSVEITPAEDGAAELNGLFGPNPNVWTLFLAWYAVLILGAVFAGVLGMSQLLVKAGSAWGLWVSGACTVALVLPYTGSLLGQRWAAEQMDMLRCFLRASLDLDGEAETPPPTCVDEGLVTVDEGGAKRLPVL